MGRSFPMYGIMAGIGAFAAGFLACFLIRRRKMNDNDMLIVLLFVALGVVVGGTTLYAITNIRLVPVLFKVKNFEQLVAILSLLLGGSVFYGGLIGGTLVGVITVKVKKLPLKIYADIIAVIIPLFHAFARVGCFLGGCCYGIESKFGFTAHGNELVPALNDVSRFPVQLLESTLNLVIFAVLLLLYRKSLSGGYLAGKLIFCYLVMYSVVRFCDEFLRGDAIRGFVFGLSTSQFISIILFAVSVTVFAVTAVRYKGKKQITE
ncbi:MAG: prolipoprotein diacylglyceryl transferase [Clostridia bacterium]|nr:prolipoprotein diacylglyceryl transferase [Clostridia bacterium]